MQVAHPFDINVTMSWQVLWLGIRKHRMLNFYGMAFGGSVYLASFIDSIQKDSVTCSNTTASNASLPQQNPLSDTKNITSAEFPNGHQILLGAGSEHIYLH